MISNHIYSMVLLTGGIFCPYDPADWYCCWRAALHTILLPFRSVLFCSIIHLCCSVSSVKCTKPNTAAQIKHWGNRNQTLQQQKSSNTTIETRHWGKRDNQRQTCQCMSNYYKSTTASRKAHKNSLSRKVKRRFEDLVLPTCEKSLYFNQGSFHELQESNPRLHIVSPDINILYAVF